MINGICHEDGKNKARPPLTEDERITRGTTSIQYARHTLIQTHSCPIAITDAAGDAYLAKLFNTLLSGGIRKVFGAGSHHARLAVREYGFRTGSRSLHLRRIYPNQGALSRTFFSEFLARVRKPNYNVTVGKGEEDLSRFLRSFIRDRKDRMRTL